MIELSGNITIGGQIIIGDVAAFVLYFVTEDDNFLVSQIDQNFVEEQ
jgi:hypothetical protein